MGFWKIILIAHALSAAGLVIWCLFYGLGLRSAWQWAVAGLMFGVVPFGIFAWRTREDSSDLYKVSGFFLTLGLEVGLLIVALRLSS